MLMVRLPCEAACVMGGEDILRAQATPTTGMKETEPAMTRRADGGSRGPRQPLRWVNAQQTTKRRRTVFVTGDANIHETSFKLSRKTAAFKYYDDSLILPKEMKRRSHLFAVPLPQPVPADPVMAPIDDVQLYRVSMHHGRNLPPAPARPQPHGAGPRAPHRSIQQPACRGTRHKNNASSVSVKCHVLLCSLFYVGLNLMVMRHDSWTVDLL